MNIIGLFWEENHRMNAKDIVGLFCDDITFCPEKCDTRTCPRNKCNIRDYSVPHSFFADNTPPSDCPKKEENKE